MKIMCKQNFLCNKVAGAPGKFLSKEEIKQIGSLMGELKSKGLVHGGDDLATEPTDPAEGNGDLVGDNLPADGDDVDLGDSDEVEEEIEEEEADGTVSRKKVKKSKKGKR